MATEVECAAMRRDIDHLAMEVRALRAMQDSLTEIKVKLDRVLDVIDGSERHADIGALKRIDALERETITKRAVGALAAFVAAVMGALAAAVTVFAHGIWK